MKVLVTQSCLTLCSPMDCSSSDSFVLGLLQARTPSLGDLPNSGIKPSSPTLQSDSLPAESQGKLRMHLKPLYLKPRHNVPILGLRFQRHHSGLPVTKLSYNVKNLVRVEKRQGSGLSLPVSSSCYPFWNSRSLPKCPTFPCRALLPSFLLSSS